MQREERGDLPVSPHFELSALADGVYAAIATDEGAAYSNAGIVDLGELTLIFDAFDSPEAAFDLLAAAEALTGRPPSCVAISHMHWDHWGGNQAIAPHVPILTSHAIRGGMPSAVGWLEDLQQNPDLIETWLAEERARLQVRYIEVVEDLVAAAVRDGLTEEEMVGQALPTPFDAWQREGPARWEANVRALYERVSEAVAP